MLSTRGRRRIRPLEALGYVVKPRSTRWEVEIPIPNEPNNICVAGLVVPGGTASGMLIIRYINTSVDLRPRTERPRASDILLGFRKFTVDLPVSSLMCLSFYMVQEPTVCLAVWEIYPKILLLPALCRAINIPGIELVGGPAGADQEAFELLVQTKFGHIAARILTGYEEGPRREGPGSGAPEIRSRIAPLRGDLEDAALEECVANGARLTVENICFLFDLEVYFC